MLVRRLLLLILLQSGTVLGQFSLSSSYNYITQQFHKAKGGNSNVHTGSEKVSQSVVQALFGKDPSKTPLSAPKSLAPCLRDLVIIVTANVTTDPWALKYFDSQATKPSGVLNGYLSWYGDYDECLSIQAVPFDDDGNTFSPKYCHIGIGSPNTTVGKASILDALSGLNLGLCLPNDCDLDDIINLVNPILSANFSMEIIPGLSACVDQNLPFDYLSIISITVYIIIAAAMFLALAIDLYFPIKEWWGKRQAEQEVRVGERQRLVEDASSSYYTTSQKQKEGENDKQETKTTPKEPEPPRGMKKFLLTYAAVLSPYSNFHKLVSVPPLVDETGPTPNLSGLNGVRVLSLIWVVIGHTYAFSLNWADNILPALTLFTRTSFMFIVAGLYAVDTFLFLSGFLAYWALAPRFERNKKSFWKSLPMLYFLRYLRLTPPVIAVTLLDLGIYQHLSTGPFYFQRVDEVCLENWWTNVLYVSNYVNAKDECLGWLWYLAVDNQVFLITPFVVFLFIWKAKAGWAASIVLILIQAIVSIALTVQYNLPSFPIGLNTDLKNYDDFFTVMYIPAYTRWSPYIVGIMTCHLVIRHPRWLNRKIFRRPLIQGIMWALALGTMLACTYGMHHMVTDPTYDSLFWDSMYNAFAKTAWAVAIGWLFISITLNRAGPVGTILSWPVWSLPARLSYCAYLCHPFVIYFFVHTSRRPFHLTDVTAVYLFFGVLVGSLMLSLVMSLAFESPIVGIVRMLNRKG